MFDSAVVDPATLLDDLEYWLRHDTWTVRDGLLLLVGIDPRGASVGGITLTDDKQSVGRCSMLGQVYKLVGCDPDPEPVFALFRLRAWWMSAPERAAVERCAPTCFIEFARTKGHRVPWLRDAEAAGLLAAAAVPFDSVEKDGTAGVRLVPPQLPPYTQFAPRGPNRKRFARALPDGVTDDMVLGWLRRERVAGLAWGAAGRIAKHLKVSDDTIARAADRASRAESSDTTASAA